MLGDYEHWEKIKTILQEMVDTAVRNRHQELLANAEECAADLGGALVLLRLVHQAPHLIYSNADGMQTCAFCGVIGLATGGNHHHDDCLLPDIRHFLEETTDAWSTDA